MPICHEMGGIVVSCEGCGVLEGVPVLSAEKCDIRPIRRREEDGSPGPMLGIGIAVRPESSDVIATPGGVVLTERHGPVDADALPRSFVTDVIGAVACCHDNDEMLPRGVCRALTPATAHSLLGGKPAE